jgi:hypothetical protein
MTAKTILSLAQAHRKEPSQANYKADAAGYEFLFADLAQLAHKAADDFALVVKARIDAHKVDVAAKADAKEAADAEAAAKPATVNVMGMQVEREIYEGTQFYQQHIATAPAIQATGRMVSVPLKSVHSAPPALRLGVINERLAPINLTAEGLRSLGFEHATKDRAAVLYHDADFPLMCAALVKHINSLQVAQAA